MSCTCSTDLKPVERNGHTATCNHLQRKAARQPKTPARRKINHRSATRAKEEAEYQKERKVWLIGKECAKCGRKHDPPRFELSVQHLAGRSGKMLLKKEFWLPLCVDPCHIWANEHPAEAIKLGFAMKRLAIQPKNEV